MLVNHGWRAIRRNLFYNGAATEFVVVVVGGVRVVRAWFLDRRLALLIKGAINELYLPGVVSSVCLLEFS
jgi:hypothetical protein